MNFHKIQAMPKCTGGWQMGNYVMTNKKIREGVFGDIFEGSNLGTNTQVVIKMLKYSASKLLESDINFVAKATNSPFIVKLQDAFLLQEKDLLYLVFDRFNGSLTQYIEKYNQDQNNEDLIPGESAHIGLPVSEAIGIFCQIVEGCLAMWRVNITHGDIKPDNILYRFDAHKNKNIFGIADFGISKINVTSTKTNADTTGFRAPEVIKGELYNYCVDVWALGMTLHEMLFGPFFSKGRSEKSINEETKALQYKLTTEQKAKIPEAVAELLEAMMRNNQYERMTKEDLEKRIKKFKEYEFVGGIIGLVPLAQPPPKEEEVKMNEKVIKPIGQLGEKKIYFQMTQNFEEGMENLYQMSANLKPNDKLFLNFNQYKVEWKRLENYDYKWLQGIPYDKTAMGKVVKMVGELSTKVQELTFHYINSELQVDESKQLAQLQNQYPKNVYSYYTKSINLRLTSGNFNELNTQLAQLTPSHLVCLHLNAAHSGFGNNEAQKIATILNSIQNLSKLHLNLDNNNIKTEGAIQIAKALENCHLLSNLFLNFWGNQIQREGAKQISAALQKNTNISSLELYLWATDIGNDGANDIAQALKMLPNLTNLVLNAGGNNLNNTGATAIAKALLTFANSLKFTLNLHLGHNQIGDAGAKEIASALKTFKGLSYLDLLLCNNEIGNVGAIEIASALKTLNGLSYLRLIIEDNKYTEDAKKHLQEIKANRLEIQKT